MIWEIDERREVIEGLDEDGRPDPAYAAALGIRPAPLGRRALASIIEFAVYAILQLPYWLVTLPSLLALATGALTPAGLVSHPNLLWMILAASVSFVLTLAFCITQLALHGRRGVTMGKAFVGIRSVNVATLGKPTFRRALLRGLLLSLIFLVPLIGPVLFFLSPLFDGEKRGRGWLDKAAGTWFVDVAHGLNPYHEKRMRVARKTIAAEPEAAKSQLPSLATPSASAPPAYRPGARVSSGVVGVARPVEPGAATPVGLPSHAEQPAPAQTLPGMPAGGARLGGYRPGELSGRARASAPEPATSAPRPLAEGIVDSVPGRDGAPAAPAASHAAPPVAQPARSAPAVRSEPHAAAARSQISDETVIEPDLDGEIDDRTVRRIEVADDEDLEATRARPRAAAAVATLAFDNGDRFAITGAALIGRNPAPAAGEEVAHLLPFADDTRSISKTHLLITAEPLTAVDRASTNGSSVVRGGAEHPLVAGEPFALVPGDVVRFGDRAVTVEAGAAP
jgi:uncharacterized RDD family membrane protein YckC